MATKFLNNLMRGTALLTLLLMLVSSLPIGVMAVQAAPGDITRVSVDSSGTQANDWSRRTTISGDGRYVAFESDASNLVSGDTNGAGDIFVHDRQTGATTRKQSGSMPLTGDPEIDKKVKAARKKPK